MVASNDPAPAPLITLRPYQRLCVEHVVTAYQQAPRGGRALVVLPTGSGKTIVFTEVARQLRLNTLIIAHRQELLQQAAAKFHLVDPTACIGYIGAGRHEWGASVTVASVQTISRPEHLKNVKLFGYGLVILDECHHSAAAGYQAILDALPDAFVLGVTATPDRADKQNIEQFFGEPVFSASIIDMVEQGYLCDLRAIAIHTTTSLDEVHTQAGDFKIDELEEAVDTPERNRRVVSGYLTHCRERQALCFAVTVTHAHHLAEAFQSMGIHAEVVSGDMPLERRTGILHDFERGILDVVCNCGVLTEGYDCCQVSCVIMARPTRSRALFVQCVGRGVRLAPGKNDCILLDITDNCLKHRIHPLTLCTALDTEVNDGESIFEAKKRKEIEAAGDHQERTTRVTQRANDLIINVLARTDWKRQNNGSYLLEVGIHKHHIFLVPSETINGYYAVRAKLAPDFREQEWLKDSPLEWAQQHAEMKAKLLQSSEKKLVLVDNHAPWRALPVSEKQRYMLRKFALPCTEHMTAGEASDLIGCAIAKRDARKAEEKARKAARRAEGKKRARASA